MKRFIILTLLLPSVSLAAVIQAGFPSQAIWASKSSATEGETLVISAVVLNGGSETLRATLVFTAEGTRIGAREFELPSGESQIHSIEWEPKKGEYRLAAKIEGTSAELSQRETPSILVSVAAPPPPSAVQQTISQVVQTAGAIASSSAPIVMQAAQAVFSQTEALRHASIERLENYLASQASSRYLGSDPSVGMGTVAGTSTSNIAGFEGSKPKEILSNIAQAAAAAALFMMKSIALFYPLLALLILGTLYLLARRVRRKPRDD